MRTRAHTALSADHHLSMLIDGAEVVFKKRFNQLVETELKPHSGYTALILPGT